MDQRQGGRRLMAHRQHSLRMHSQPMQDQIAGVGTRVTRGRDSEEGGLGDVVVAGDDHGIGTRITALKPS